MRAGLSTIQQTLTSESAAVLNRSIAEAARRCHSQTTPLHVAATLLAGPTGLLRQACIRSHPASSHPLQCRALELCFTVALDRLPAVNTNSGSNTSATDPPISNALMAALKRAQAHQRRGCPEQQQQPLLAVKVELEQLIVSILDDPSVSRVMREASFSSPAVKATIEQSLSSSPTNSTAATAAAPVVTIAPKIPPRNLYMNPRLTAAVASGDAAGLKEPQRVLDIMMRVKKRNPVVVADSDPAAVIREVLKRLQSGDAPAPLRAAHVITLDTEFTDRSLIPAKIRELCSSIDGRIGDGGVVLDLGDLKWLVETPGGITGSNLIHHQQHQQQIVSETGRAAIAEITKLVQRFSDAGGSRLWVVASASCATYLRCQVYHPGMDNDWDLQALPIAPRSPVVFPRLGGSGILSSSVESLAPGRGFPLLGTTGASRLRPPTEATDSSKTSLCKLCMESYEQELSKLVAKKFEKSSSDSGLAPPRPLLPHWMKPTISDQIQSMPQEDEWKQSTEELLKTWQDKCSQQQHQRVNPASTFPACIPLQPLHTRLTLSQTPEPAGNLPCQSLNIPDQRHKTQPGSPVKTDLVLGQRDRLNEFTSCKLDSLSDNQGDSFDSFKKLYKGLAERVGWQPAAATAVATVVTQCKSGRPSGLRRKNEAWLMFIGPDKVGKRKMAAALSELVFAAAPITVNLVADEGGPVVRGRTSIDRVSDVVRQNPFSVVVLEGFDQADLLVKGSIKRAIKSGRMIDSQGREVSLGSVIFVLNSSWLPEEIRNSHDSMLQSEEEKILDSAGWQLEFSVFDRTGKRGAESGSGNDRPPVKKMKEFGHGAGLSLDLNLAAGVDVDAGEGSWNTSDLTFENGQESARLGINSNRAIDAANSPAAELMGLVDGAIEFKPVDFSPIRRNVLESIHAAFRTTIGNDRLIRVDDDALDIIVSGVWLTGAGVDASPFNEWADKVLFPSMHQLKSSNFMSQGGLVIVRLSAVKDPHRRQWSSSLPSTVSIASIGA